MKLKTRALISLSLAILLTGCAAVEPPTAAGIDGERLGRIDTAIERELAAGKMPGAVALVMRNGEIVYHKSFGYADIASETPMRTDNIFRIASMTKAITSVAVVMLYEQGHFQLNDPVTNYLPEFMGMSVVTSVDEAGNVTATSPATRLIRVIDLLTHSAGISYPFIPGKLRKSYIDAGIIDGVTAKDLQLESQMQLLATQPLLFEPGTAFAYGLSTDVLGYLVEVVSGKSLAQFFAEEIFSPLGMSDSYFYLPEEKADRLATLYASVDGVGLVVAKGDESELILDDPRYPIRGARSYYSGGAGLSSTAYDYGRFLQMLLNDGELDGVRLLGRKSVELMRTARIDWDGDKDADFGLGFAVITDIGERGELWSPGAYTWGGAFDTSYWIDPEEKLLGVFMSQARPARSKISEQFSTLVYQALE